MSLMYQRCMYLWATVSNNLMSEHFYICAIIYRNEAYLARTLVAVIDHNNNLDRNPSLSFTGNPMYQKVYSKRSKNWRVQVVKEDKKYDFWPSLVSRIMRKRVTDETTILRPTEMPSDHPKKISPSIAMKPIPKTSDLVQKSLSRFSNVSKPNSDDVEDDYHIYSLY